MQELAGLGVPSDEIERSADHIPSGSRDDCVGLGVDAPAELISLPGRNAELFAITIAELRAVDSSARCAVVTGGENFIVLHDDGAIFSAQAGRASKHSVCNVQIVVFFVHAFVHRAHRFLVFLFSV